MSYCTTTDGHRLYVEQHGSGEPILFIHEFAGDHRSWKPQVDHFRDRYQCIVYAARGYPPSDVPSELDAYSQARAVDDALAVLDGLRIDRAHVVGLSMGGFCALHLGLRAPERANSLVVGASATEPRRTRRTDSGVSRRRSPRRSAPRGRRRLRRSTPSVLPGSSFRTATRRRGRSSRRRWPSTPRKGRR